MNLNRSKIFEIPQESILGSIFKITWIVAALLSIYVFCFLVLLSGLTQNINTDHQKLNFWNFFLPNFASISLLILYSKELIFGYYSSSKTANFISLFTIAFVALLIMATQSDFYQWIVFQSNEGIWVKIPIILIATSILGLILNRLLRIKIIKRVQDE